jgi:MarR family transcriptional regulator, organic hydroperoxide resistance regulator
MPNSYSLEKAVPFLLARAGIGMGKEFATQLLPYKLSLIEWRVCVSLFELQNSTLGHLEEKTSYETSTLSRTINGLIKKKFITRVQSKSDRRSFALKLTPKGRTVTAKIIPLAQEYENNAIAGFNEKEADLLRSMLSRVYANMNAHSSE